MQRPKIELQRRREASALGRRRRGRVSRLEATVVGFADLFKGRDTEGKEFQRVIA
jgi:hypothetical protein